MTPSPLFHRFADPGPIAVAGPHNLSAHLHVFPLLARSAHLDAMCDRFLNVADPYMVFESVKLPLFGNLSVIALMTARYSNLDSDTDKTGVWRQRELLFAVPVRGRNVETKEETLFLTGPYTFVNEPASIGTARENYGWPKLRGYFAGDLHDGFLSMSASVVANPGAGEVFRRRRLARLTHSICYSQSNIEGVFTGGWEEFLHDLSVPEEGFFRNEHGKIVARTLGLFDFTLPWVNLKQIRDEASLATQGAAYQSLVSSPITIDDPQQFEVQAGAGCNWFQLDLYRHASLPIANMLGLMPSSSYTTMSGIEVDRFEPLFPFHVDASLDFGKPTRICWRGVDTKAAWQP